MVEKKENKELNYTDYNEFIKTFGANYSDNIKNYLQELNKYIVNNYDQFSIHFLHEPNIVRIEKPKGSKGIKVIGIVNKKDYFQIELSKSWDKYNDDNMRNQISELKKLFEQNNNFTFVEDPSPLILGKIKCNYIGNQADYNFDNFYKDTIRIIDYHLNNAKFQ
ncbi:MAG: hypothetical protein NTU43_12135 [Bacteroidetes bacterium]|nr:hypothetical protein [Bacteroidota bacterium]